MSDRIDDTQPEPIQEQVYQKKVEQETSPVGADVSISLSTPLSPTPALKGIPTDLHCPRCGEFVKKRYCTKMTSSGKVQRYQCLNGHVFREQQ